MIIKKIIKSIERIFKKKPKFRIGRKDAVKEYEWLMSNTNNSKFELFDTHIEAFHFLFCICRYSEKEIRELFKIEKTTLKRL